MSSTDIIEILKRNDLFKNLLQKEILKFLEDCQIVQYDQGMQVLTKGSIDTNIKVIVKGSVYLTRSDGTEVTLSQGAYFGELNLLNENVVSADVFSKEECHVLHIPYSHIYKSYSENLRIYGVLMENLARILAKRLQNIRRKI